MQVPTWTKAVKAGLCPPLNAEIGVTQHIAGCKGLTGWWCERAADQVFVSLSAFDAACCKHSWFEHQARSSPYRAAAPDVCLPRLFGPMPPSSSSSSEATAAAGVQPANNTSSDAAAQGQAQHSSSPQAEPAGFQVGRGVEGQPHCRLWIGKALETAAGKLVAQHRSTAASTCGTPQTALSRRMRFHAPCTPFSPAAACTCV